MINIKDVEDIDKLLKDYNNSLDSYNKKYCYKVMVECNEGWYELTDNYGSPFRTLEEALFEIGVHHSGRYNHYIYHINRYKNNELGTIELDKKDFEIVK